MQKILNKIIIIIFLLITACAESFENIKKGLGGEKRTSTDEFLVRKKRTSCYATKMEKSTRTRWGNEIR